MKVLVAHSCLTLFNPVDCSPSGSSLHGIFQQEYWNRLPFLSPGDIPDPGIEPTSPALAGGLFTTESPGKSFRLCVCVCVCVCVLSHLSPVWLFATLWTAAHEASLSMGFSRQEYWSGLPCPPPGDFSHPGIEPAPNVCWTCKWVLYHCATWEALRLCDCVQII